MRTDLSDYIENSIRTLIHTIQHTTAQNRNTSDEDIPTPNGISVRLVLNTVSLHTIYSLIDAKPSRLRFLPGVLQKQQFPQNNSLS